VGGGERPESRRKIEKGEGKGEGGGKRGGEKAREEQGVGCERTGGGGVRAVATMASMRLLSLSIMGILVST
jgi:hypothetical protein